MIAFPVMLKGAAELAGMKVPPDLEKYSNSDYPHWHCFCVLQLGRAVTYHGEHWDNAKIIAAVPDDDIMKFSVKDFIALGLHYSQ